MYIFSFLFMLACGEKTTDTAGDTAVAQPEAQPETQPDTGVESEPETQPDTASEPEGPQPSNEPEGDAANGESIVNSRCMGCHGGNPAIENAGSMTDEELRDLFANGKGGMPPVNLSESELLDVIAYLRATYGGGQ